MKSNLIITGTLIGISIVVFSCKKESIQTGAIPILPSEPYAYNVQPANSMETNPFGNLAIDNHKATLGRVLFYEKQLSVNNAISCGSCHLQNKGFADKAAFSDGFSGGKTLRNTPGLLNSGTQQSYFWDMRENNLHAMVTQPISDHIEMGLEQPAYLLAKVRSLPYYLPLFENAFGDEDVTMSRVGEALAHFVSSVITVESRFDQGKMNGFANFTPMENMGRALFFNELPCGSCHGGDNFSGWGSMAQNIGLETEYSDPGVPGTDWMTGEEMNGWFKVPGLRNIELTAPYMHDGRFNTLEEVVNFYDQGIQPHTQLAFNLREGWDQPFIDPLANGLGEPLRMNLSGEQKAALVSFLKTLTDHKMVTDPKFSDPFVLKP